MYVPFCLRTTFNAYSNSNKNIWSKRETERERQREKWWQITDIINIQSKEVIKLCLLQKTENYVNPIFFVYLRVHRIYRTSIHLSSLTGFVVRLFHVCFLQFYCIYFSYCTSWIIIDKIKTESTGKLCCADFARKALNSNFSSFILLFGSRLCDLIYINGNNVPNKIIYASLFDFGWKFRTKN